MSNSLLLRACLYLVRATVLDGEKIFSYAKQGKKLPIQCARYPELALLC